MGGTYWCIYRPDQKGNVEWFTGMEGYGDRWSSDWTKRARFGARAGCMSRLWDLRLRIGGIMSVVRVGQRTGWRCECVITGGGRADGTIVKGCPAHLRWLAKEKAAST